MISYSNIFAGTVLFISSLSSTQCSGYCFTSSALKILLNKGQKQGFLKMELDPLKIRRGLIFPKTHASVYVHANFADPTGQYFKIYSKKSMIHRSSACLNHPGTDNVILY